MTGDDKEPLTDEVAELVWVVAHEPDAAGALRPRAPVDVQQELASNHRLLLSLDEIIEVQGQPYRRPRPY